MSDPLRDRVTGWLLAHPYALHERKMLTELLDKIDRTITLQWEPTETVHVLFAGRQPVGFLQHRQGLWKSDLNLPGLEHFTADGPLDEQKALMETAVREWFAEALNAAPVAETKS